MRQLLIICAIFIQLLGYFSAEAKVAVPLKAGSETKATYGVGASFHEDHLSGAITSTVSGNISFKTRQPRTIADMANGYHEPAFSLLTHTCSSAYASPFYLPLIRLLLFPNHYFW